MAVNQDFRDLFAALNDAGAKFLLVGGYAVAFHAQPRFTKDLDIWIDTDGGNPTRVFDALHAFGAPLLDLSAADLALPDVIFQIGVAPNRVDIVTSIDGVAFAEAWEGRETTRYGDQDVPVISRVHLIQNKRAAGRPQDLIDIDILESSQPGL